MKFFKNLFKKTEEPIKKMPFPIGSFIIHIPPFLDNTQLGKIVRYDNFGNPVTDTFVAIGYCIPFSPLALETILKLTPLERLAIFSQFLLPKHEIDYTLNYQTLTSNSIPETIIQEANVWYDNQPVNNIEIIVEELEPHTVTKIKRKRRTKTRTPRPPKKITNHQPDPLS